jgi:hypothetical protein
MKWQRMAMIGLTLGLLIWGMRTPKSARPLYPLNISSGKKQPLADRFNPAECGSIDGQIVWEGEVPTVEPLPTHMTPYTPVIQVPRPNPLVPQVSSSRGLADTIIRLQRVDLARSRPWNLPVPTVEANNLDFRVHSNGQESRYGIIQAGSTIDLVSRERMMHSIRAQGADYFTQMLIDPNRPVARTFTTPGIAELTSGSFFYWARSYLIVSDHPYVAISDAEGRFRLDQVPAGEYEITCWKGNWQIDHYDRDPEYLVPVRMVMKPPVEKVQKVRITKGESSTIRFTFTSGEFGEGIRMPAR